MWLWHVVEAGDPLGTVPNFLHCCIPETAKVREIGYKGFEQASAGHWGLVSEPNIDLCLNKGLDMQKTLLSSVALVALTGFASAADMPLKAAPVPVYVSTWTGCYIGGHAGYGKETSTDQYTMVEPGAYGPYRGYNDQPMPVTNGYDNKGFVGGGQGGCQYQTGSFLWGIEGDWSSFSNSVNKAYNSSWHTDWESGYANRSNVTSLSLNKDSLWSVRAKFGLITQSDFMLYGTLGIGGEKASYDYASRYNSNGCYDYCEGGWDRTHSISGSVGATPTGIVAGVGADWKIYNNWILGVLYLHYAVSETVALPLNKAYDGYRVGPGTGDHVSFGDVDVVRVNLSYLFNWGLR
jgi:outer membrane immunogenic protein